MPRPRRGRRVCMLPRCPRFGPPGHAAQTLPMAVEEYETLRLIDHQGLTQAQCAERMGVGRTTVQAIYAEARHKLARCLVEGLSLEIGGGDYRICSHPRGDCRRHGHCPRLITSEEDSTMIIATTHREGQIFGHFGQSTEFKVYTVEDGAITGSEVRPVVGEGHGALAGLLKSWQVDKLICGGIGGGARSALDEAGIELYPGAEGDTDAQVAALLNGTLRYDPDTACAHHEHGEHGHGEHHHGHGHHR